MIVTATATWVWVLVAIVVFPLVGLLVMLALGLFGAPADAVRRAWQTVTMRQDVSRGTVVPDEVPEEPPRRKPGPRRSD